MAIKLFVKNDNGTYKLLDESGNLAGDVHVQRGVKVNWKMDGTDGHFDFHGDQPFGVPTQVIYDPDDSSLTVNRNAAPGRYEYDITCDNGQKVIDSPPRVIVD